MGKEKQQRCCEDPARNGMRVTLRQWVTSTLWPPLARMAPLLFATFICSLFTVIHVIARWTGSQAYLILPYLYLFLNPSDATIGQHVENLILILVGCFCTLAISFLALCGTVWIDGVGAQEPLYSDKSKVVAACTLVGLFFVGGFVGSILPRFNNAVRAGLFSAVFPLTRGASRIEWTIVSDFWYPLCLAVGASLLANLLISPKTANSHFALLLVRTLDDTSEVVRRTVGEFFQRGDDISKELLSSRQDMLTSAADLAHALDQAAHEVAFSRMPVVKYQTTLAPVKRITTWISCGLGLGSEDSELQVDEDYPEGEKSHGSESANHALPSSPSSHHDFRPLLENFAQEITTSFEVVAAVVKLTLAPDVDGKPAGTTIAGLIATEAPSQQSEGKRYGTALETQRRKLQTAVNEFRSDLDELLELPHHDDDRAQASTPSQVRRRKGRDGSDAHSPPTLFKSTMYEMSFLMVSLLEIAKEADAALAASQEHLGFWEAHPRRSIWWPVVPWKNWLRKTGGGLVSKDEMSYNHRSLHFEDEGTHEDDTSAPAQEEEYCRRIFADGVDEEKRVDVTQQGREIDQPQSKTARYLAIVHRARAASRHPAVLQARFAASRAFKAIKRSRHVHFAIKLTLGASLLTLPAWLESSRTWYTVERGAWAVISYLWVLETSSGATVRTAVRRVAGTIMGCVLGLVAVEMGRGNAYALVVLLTVFLGPSAYLMTETMVPAVGVVSGAALSLVVGISYTQYVVPVPPGSVRSAAVIAAIRGYEVGAGIIAALLINLFLWPYHARVECVLNIARATTQMQQLYTSLARQMLQRDFVLTTTVESSQRFSSMEGALLKRLRFSRSLLSVMDGEVSLVLRPVSLLDDIIARLERISHLLVALRHCREKGFRHLRSEIVWNVQGPRQDLVSCVSLVLWTIGQALRTHSPLPQFLPSPRVALRDLTIALREQVEARRERNVDSPISPTPPASIAPDAYHALMRISGDPHWRQSTRSVRSSPATRRESPHRSGTNSPVALACAGTPTTGRTTTKRRPHFQRELSGSVDVHGRALSRPARTYLWMFAEHSILAAIIDEMEGVLDHTRDLCGEVTFIRE